jgi:hypothetical protein
VNRRSRRPSNAHSNVLVFPLDRHIGGVDDLARRLRAALVADRANGQHTYKTIYFDEWRTHEDRLVALGQPRRQARELVRALMSAAGLRLCAIDELRD